MELCWWLMVDTGSPRTACFESPLFFVTQAGDTERWDWNR